jgi:hypothetical protein
MMGCRYLLPALPWLAVDPNIERDRSAQFFWVNRWSKKELCRFLPLNVGIYKKHLRRKNFKTMTTSSPSFGSLVTPDRGAI